MAGLRDAGWLRHGGERCFGVSLLQDAGDSFPGRSFPLVRGGGKMKITPPNVEREINI
jgi:hypothetical protein